MAEFRFWLWLTIATLGYCVLFLRVTTLAQLTLAEALIPAGALTAFALAAQLFPRPWRHRLAAIPWLLVLAWIVYLYEGSLDCGADCDGASVGGVLLLV